MSENPSGLDRIAKRLKNLKPHNKEGKKANSESEAIARESVQLFAASENQEPLATYYADSPSTFNLLDQKPGTIFRVEGEEVKYLGVTAYVYSWFVVGNNDGQKVNLYMIDHELREEVILSAEENLRLGKSWNLMKIEPTTTSFPIKDTLNVFASHTPDLDKGISDLPVGRLDVMSGGKTAKQTEKEPSRNPKLVPSTVAAKI